jgi:hypothetical protein
MSQSIESIELKRFHQALIQDIKSTQVSEEEGGTLEQIFTQIAVDLLVDAGETENVRVAYDEGQFGTRNQHKINAYAEPDNYETIDLIVTVFRGTDEPTKVAKDDVETAAKRISNFFRKAKYKSYIDEIEESSEIWDFAHTLSTSELLDSNLVRINAIILTDGLYQGETPGSQDVLGCPIFFRIVDLTYLYNVSVKSHIPIEIDFLKEGFDIPCIASPSENDQYQSYLAIIPGSALATIYERYGSRLLEQNVRSFLQFTGTINKGIRATIRDSPHMFLAYNNGIAATAEHVDLAPDGRQGLVISKVRDFQIVNGGQTTASIYHTQKKDKADLTEVFVQVKLTVIKSKDRFSEIVSSIAEYANTQNKVSVSDLSSNKPFHVELEKLSRGIFTPHTAGQLNQTKWFYERARGQYKNARLKEGFTRAKQKAFDIKNPRKQVFTKEDLAKYVNAYQEMNAGKKVVIGPHIVVRGNQKNYVQFINHKLIEKPDNQYFEDVVSKGILFRAAEKVYGVKPHSIGDLRYVTVPYTLSLLSYSTANKIDLYKIWKNQRISEALMQVLYDLMVRVEAHIKQTAPGALYGEWAKREDCWNDLKQRDFKIDFKTLLKGDFEDPRNPSQRRRVEDAEVALVQIQDELASIRSLPSQVWRNIEHWGRDSELLSAQQTSVAHIIAERIGNRTRIADGERQMATIILDRVIEKAPELLDEVLELNGETDRNSGEPEITIDLIDQILQWDKKNRQLKEHEFRILTGFRNGNTEPTDRNFLIARICLIRLKKHGFGA